MTKELLEETLFNLKWDVRLASEIIGITRASIYKQIKKWGLSRPDTFIKGNWNRTKTRCPRGHEYSPETTYVNKFGYRVCRPCADLRKEINGPLLHQQTVLQPVVQNSMHKKVGDRHPRRTVTVDRRPKNRSICDDSTGQNHVPRLPGHPNSYRGKEVDGDEVSPLQCAQRSGT